MSWEEVWRAAPLWALAGALLGLFLALFQRLLDIPAQILSWP